MAGEKTKQNNKNMVDHVLVFAHIIYKGQSRMTTFFLLGGLKPANPARTSLGNTAGSSS